MGHRHDKKCCHCKDDCKKDCLCKILKKFEGNDVTLKTKSGDMITGELQKVTKDCCVKIVEPDMITPFVNEQLTVIRCKDIEHFSIDLLFD
ncbi:hypothetical protein WQ57_00890 [Mesobacillus campisalis]|uniref:DUF2642 domain-containing protein n=1 Tax=Mesobacillus campisalis TaxID=1408103 RepID=A0A0M2SZ94_9BACI|nr:hypothetical protein WQ57_00890 [Mesobacillus campisalis]